VQQDIVFGERPKSKRSTNGAIKDLTFHFIRNSFSRSNEKTIRARPYHEPDTTRGPMSLDAIIISEAGTASFSATHPLNLTLDGRVADIQVVSNYLRHHGRVVDPVAGNNGPSWSSAPKLNGIYLLSYLTRQRFHVALINSFYEEKNAFARLLEASPKAIVISTTFITEKTVLKKLASDIRSMAPDIFIVAGGPFVYTSFQLLQRAGRGGYDTASAKQQSLFLDTADEPQIDLYIISRRGETVLRDALSRLADGRPVNGIPNTAVLDGNTFRFSERIDDTLGAEDTPIDWAGLPDAVFGSGVVSMQASTGCPFNCAFCNFIKDRRMNRIRPLDRIVSEMKAVSRRGASHVWFVDDNFRLGKRDLGTVCRRLIEEGISLNWMTFIRADALVGEDLRLLKEAGCQEVQLGLESADPAILKQMNKKASPQLFTDVLTRLRAAGIHCSCYFIFGFPGETPRSAQRTRAFIQTHAQMDLPGDIAFSLFPFLLIPLSPIYEPEARRPHALAGYMREWTHRGMDARGAVREIWQTFMSMEKAGSIYRGDNLDLLQALGTTQRKAFKAARHGLARDALEGRLTREKAIRAFENAFSMHAPP
jgi:radical SAM superfamily enzyme YgiQ (UPF0313 family)